MFDLRTMSLRWETNVKNGVCIFFPWAECDMKPVHLFFICIRVNTGPKLNVH